MFKVLASLTNYQINVNNTHNGGPIPYIWYKYDKMTGDGSCLSQLELNQVIKYFNTRPQNFSNINQMDCLNENTPSCGVSLNVSGVINQQPNLILEQCPQFNNPQIANRMSCISIHLCDINGNISHIYTLKFDLIGELYV